MVARSASFGYIQRYWLQGQHRRMSGCLWSSNNSRARIPNCIFEPVWAAPYIRQSGPFTRGICLDYISSLVGFVLSHLAWLWKDMMRKIMQNIIVDEGAGGFGFPCIIVKTVVLLKAVH